ncbi:hypothetical protein [Paludifilum halophilum]|uniref:Pyroglutamyl peptidase n=1 Tax=Paludifilum halophilum TaxID=1642702 RepID=A0A235BCD8_9BACL|nr:hypothetical protein [Paludifilum halophilum]OYD09872.1 hypothetical protein CHM34_02510 [Paludifilum halophilum]
MFHKKTWKSLLIGLVTVSMVVVSFPPGVSAERGAECYDVNRPVTPEEQRIDDGKPIPRQILEDSRFDRFVEEFQQDLCRSSGPEAAKRLVEKTGVQLWKTAVDRAQGKRPDLGNLDRYDDRPLYWARLHMTRALRQWDPNFTVTEKQRSKLLMRLEYTSRGLTTVRFPKGKQIKRVMVSGFDPYRLEQEFRRSNPSGASVLQMDGQRIETKEGPAIIQSVMFPVRWRDFEDGIVEDAFGPYLKKGPNRIDLMMTISQGRPQQMDIEGFAGRWHTGTDNELAERSTEIPPVSHWPMPDSPLEFIETTLPYQAMVEAETGPWPVLYNDEVCEWLPPDYVDPYVCHEGGPTPGSKARSGGGGSYLSNESQYRSNRLRIALGADDIPGGHLHNAALQNYPEDKNVYIDAKFREERRATVDQTVALVQAAARSLYEK